MCHSTDAVLSTDDNPAIAAALSLVQESSAEPPIASSQSLGETLKGETQKIQLLSPQLNPQRTWEPSSEIAATPDPVKRDSRGAGS